MSLDLSAIRARAETFRRITKSGADVGLRFAGRSSAADVPALLAEVERLRPVVEAARRAVDTDGVDEWNELVDVVDRFDQTKAATR